MQGTNTIYTQAYCTDVCVQARYNIDQYGCLDGSRQFTDTQLASVNYSLCGNLSLIQIGSMVDTDGFKRFLKFMTKDKSMENDVDCGLSCLTPCAENQYSTSVNSPAWPDMRSQLIFYQQYLMGRTRYGTKFEPYARLYNSFVNDKFNSSTVNELQQLLEAGLLSRNFLQLNVRFDPNGFNLQTDAPGFTKDAMGAQIGGVLSLWLGVTIMVLFEIFEFLYSLMATYCDKRKETETAVAQPDPPIEIVISV